MQGIGGAQVQGESKGKSYRVFGTKKSGEWQWCGVFCAVVVDK